MYTVGIDLGSTTVCAVVAETVTGKLLFSKSVPNSAALPSVHHFEHLQDPSVLLQICEDLLNLCLKDYPVPVSIGITGQMHGILYLDSAGNPLSPLYTWQDQSGNEAFASSSYAEAVSELTGYHISSGFGIATCFFHLKNERIPEHTSVFCTIGDFVAMKLCGRSSPLLHPSMAASLGAFDLEKNAFDTEALSRAGIPLTLLPRVALSEKELGIHSSGTSVTLAIGDNQASYYGSCQLPGTLLINIGTGGQLSLAIQELPSFLPEGLEVRPYLNHSWLLTASSLCSGSAYTLLKNFFMELLKEFSADVPSDPYTIINKMAEAGASSSKIPVTDTRFLGSRTDPKSSGTISGLTFDSFHPSSLVYSVLKGICEELYQFYEQFPAAHRTGLRLMGSGNGLRKNPLLQTLFSERFQMPLSMTPFEEEAAYGCALYAFDLASGTFFFA